MKIILINTKLISTHFFIPLSGYFNIYPLLFFKQIFNVGIYSFQIDILLKLRVDVLFF